MSYATLVPSPWARSMAGFGTALGWDPGANPDGNPRGGASGTNASWWDPDMWVNPFDPPPYDPGDPLDSKYVPDCPKGMVYNKDPLVDKVGCVPQKGTPQPEATDWTVPVVIGASLVAVLALAAAAVASAR